MRKSHLWAQQLAYDKAMAKMGTPPKPREDVETPLHAVLGAMLRITRDRLGFSREQVAQATGLSAIGIGAIEMGRTVPTMRSFLCICDALGLDVELKTNEKGPTIKAVPAPATPA